MKRKYFFLPPIKHRILMGFAFGLLAVMAGIYFIHLSDQGPRGVAQAFLAALTSNDIRRAEELCDHQGLEELRFKEGLLQSWENRDTKKPEIIIKPAFLSVVSLGNFWRVRCSTEKGLWEIDLTKEGLNSRVHQFRKIPATISPSATTVQTPTHDPRRDGK